jgi:uncharacterized protein
MVNRTSRRVTLGFRTGRGREYLYDDVTGCIFPWNALRERALEFDIAGEGMDALDGLVSKYGGGSVQAALRFVRHWREKYGAFVREWSDDFWTSCPEPSNLEQIIRNRSFELLLVLTENCNLCCKYCALSEVYPLNRVRSTARMSLETAKRAIDFYIDLVSPQMARNPHKRFGLSLYGGEPMMNMAVLNGLLAYCRDVYPDSFLPVMTTNGTLLTPKLVETLIEHDVQIAISIDGPENEHDRLRVDVEGRGSFARIAKNLRFLKEEHSEYWATKVTSVSVFDWGTDLESVEAFFAENEDMIPRSIFVNAVGSRNTQWYERYTPADWERMNVALARLRKRYKQAKIEGEAPSSYSSALIGMGISLMPLRRRLGDSRPHFLPFSGTCVPGDKIAVHVDGKIDMCERVNGTYPIGHLDHGGIDYERLREMIDRYRSQVLANCPACPATKHCNLCFSLLERKDGFAADEGLCANAVNEAKRCLSDYVSILEANPDADFSIETDTVRLQERMLFNF